ncbi:BTAD domain-containing putative transcriptional regulator [Nonomuraea angiospora]|uniref:AfsR/SARP family transcriptional regulator n=1 Tax=Nonomuraea angiospora TaxID=46172 RepID=UPI00344EDBF7
MRDSELRFEVFGSVRAWRGDQELSIGPSKQRAGLALLLLSGGKLVPAKAFHGFLWDLPPANAAGLVQTYVSRLRKIIGRSALVSERAGYRLDVLPDQIDLFRFRALKERAGSVPSGAASLFAAAFAGVSGRPCADLGDHVRSHPLVAEVERELREAAMAYADCGLSGANAEVAHLLEWIATTAPLEERLFSRLIRAYAMSGRQADALITYERIRTSLRDELGIGPGAELRAAYQDLLTQQPHDPRPVQPPSDMFVTRPAPLSRPPGNAPEAAPAPLVGREVDLSALADAATRHRVVTVVGPPGVGKTALACALLRRDAPMSHEGSAFVDLAGVSRDGAGERGVRADMTSMIMAALRGGQGEQKSTADDRHEEGIATLLEELRDRRILLVLDGAEHVVRSCGQLVTRITHSCPETTTVITSRRPMGLPGEIVQELGPLAFPAPAEPADPVSHPAVELFLKAASRSSTDLDLREVADACRRLDGLPLALCLAASVPCAGGWSGRVDPVLTELAESVGRSFDLLTTEQRLLLALLSHIPSPFSLEDAERWARAHRLFPTDVAMLLGDLVEHSLVQWQPAPLHRYQILAPIRRTAVTCLSLD